MASIAGQLYAARKMACRLSPLILMSDPRRPDTEALAEALPQGSTLIYRHFGDENCEARALALKTICKTRDHQFLIGKDHALAQKIGAHGVHLPQIDLKAASGLREQHPNWIITAALHDPPSFDRAQLQPLDAILVSSIFESQSPSAGAPLGPTLFSRLAFSSKLPLFALGGVNGQTAERLLGSGAAGLAGVSGLSD